ncbi:TonB-dependent receptor domain-containing protein [Bradyrhizobium japonicum]
MFVSAGRRGARRGRVRAGRQGQSDLHRSRRDLEAGSIDHPHDSRVLSEVEDARIDVHLFHGHRHHHGHLYGQSVLQFARSGAGTCGLPVRACVQQRRDRPPEIPLRRCRCGHPLCRLSRRSRGQCRLALHRLRPRHAAIGHHGQPGRGQAIDRTRAAHTPGRHRLHLVEVQRQAGIRLRRLRSQPGDAGLRAESIPDPAISSSTAQRQTQSGVYVQDQARLDHWILTLSGRSDWVSTTGEDLFALTRQTQSDQAYSGRAGLTYVFDSGVAPYVAYSTSFFPNLGVDPSGAFFKPTTGKQTEVGVKYQPQGTRSFITAAVFD